MTFASLGVAPALVDQLVSQKLIAPTPVQQATIPAVLAGSDLLVSARTGSGKTLAFALPLLQQLHGDMERQLLAGNGQPPRIRPLRALVLVPTRELAVQVGEVLRTFAPALSTGSTGGTAHVAAATGPRRIKVGIVFGGISINPQMMALRGGCDVLVATPGRLLDLVRQNATRLGDVAWLVLDEADRLLEPGFAEELGEVLGQMPARRQNLWLSATISPAVEAAAEALLREPVRIAMADDAPTEGAAGHLLQRAISVAPARRTELLRHLFTSQGWKRVMVFVATRHAADTVAAKLYRHGIFATAFHGDLSQGTRAEILREFKAERWEILVTTDLAARGIDIADLQMVLNYDLPRSADDYIHRIGRTARAGAGGTAISFVTPESVAHFRLIERRHALALTLEEVAGFEPAAPGTSMEASKRASIPTVPKQPAPASAHPAASGHPGDANGGVKGKRPSRKDRIRAATALSATAGAPHPAAGPLGEPPVGDGRQ